MNMQATTKSPIFKELTSIVRKIFYETAEIKAVLMDDKDNILIAGVHKVSRAALKNIVAIAAGISDGLGYGLNSRAALITRGLAEITRMGVAMGADPVTFSGLSGLGDLVLTCTGDLSRNRTVGLKLGEGKSLSQVLDEMNMVAEGIKTTKSVHGLMERMKVDMPILDQVYQILYKDKDCSEAVKDLLTRELKVE